MMVSDASLGLYIVALVTLLGLYMEYVRTEPYNPALGEEGLNTLLQRMENENPNRRDAVRAYMRAHDPVDNNNRLVVDLKQGVTLATQPVRSNLQLNVVSLARVLFDPSGGPLDPRSYTLVTPWGSRLKREERPIPPISDDVKLDRAASLSCNLSREDARKFLCQRGIFNDDKVADATDPRRDQYCTRELFGNAEDRVCALHRACIRRVVRDHFSEDVPLFAPLRYLVGDGKRSALPDDLCA